MYNISALFYTVGGEVGDMIMIGRSTNNVYVNKKQVYI